MFRSKLLTQVLFALIFLQSAFILGAQFPKAAAGETQAAAGETQAAAEETQAAAEEDSQEQVAEKTISVPVVVCRYFEISETQLKGESHGEINTANATGDIKAFLSSQTKAQLAPTMDFEIGQSISGKPTYWVQICLNEA
jgi:hypothetical protein